MSFKQKLIDEIRAVGMTALYFGCWIAGLLLIKYLVLAEYEIAFHRWSMAVVGALILSKVVLVLEHVSLGEWIRARPAWVVVVVRTVMYSLGVAVVLAIEKGFEGWSEYGGFGQALRHVFQQGDTYHMWANTITLSGALLGFNALTLVRKHLGKGGLLRIFLSPLPEKEK